MFEVFDENKLVSFTSVHLFPWQYLVLHVSWLSLTLHYSVLHADKGQLPWQAAFQAAAYPHRDEED